MNYGETKGGGGRVGGKIMCFGVEPVQEKNSYTQGDTLFPLMLWKPGQLLTEILPLCILRGVFRIQKSMFLPFCI